jgi:hypothetical protein
MCDVIDFKTKKKKKTKVTDAKFDMDIVAEDLAKVINKHIKRNVKGFDIALALADVSVQFIHDIAPSTASAQHMLLTAMNHTLHEEIEYEKGELEDE